MIRPLLLGLLVLSACSHPPESDTAVPNILLILADDLGFGDVGVYNPEAKVATPNLDRLANEGLALHRRA